MKAIIIGGGIAGLAAANGLNKIGWQVLVYEQVPELNAAGAGLVLSANALKALRVMGLYDPVLKLGQPLHKFTIRSRKGKVLADTNHLQLSEQFGVQSSISIHRAELQQALMAQLKPQQIQTGKRFKEFSQNGQKVTVSFDGGSSDTADLLIGCDGVHSAVRQQLVPGARKRFAGYTCWRGISLKMPAGINAHQATESWGTGDRFGIVPLTHERVYWFACLNAKLAQDPAMKAMGIEALQEQFRSYHAPIKELIGLTPPNALIWNDIIDLEPITSYTHGRVVLTGDAAHATTPNMGQGACQALEGTAVLIAQLAKLPLHKALEAYNAQRVPRAISIVKRSWQLGKLAQLSNPLAVGLRNALFPLIPQSVNKKQLKELMDIELEVIPQSYQRQPNLLDSL
jgi:2-polyprenyl-6-methoxyphenol hydroxylase-like FAD-dependent oxidoreductase